MKYILFTLLCCLPFLLPGQSGKLKPADLERLVAAEAELRSLAYVMATDSSEEKRYTACKALITGLVEALKTPNSYQYDFPNLEGVKILADPNNSFRLFTWELFINSDEYRHFGAVQRNRKELDLTPLIDRGDALRENPENVQLPADRWLGYVAYNIMPGGTYAGQDYYFVFGYDRYETYRRRKVLDVLSFNAAGKPVFGLPVFVTYTPEGLLLADRQRLILEYAAESTVTLRFDPDLGNVVYENLILVPGGNNEGPVFLPDGSYHALEYGEDGRWTEVDKIFTHTYEEAPREAAKAPGGLDILGRPTGGGGSVPKKN
ncbi:hypothetical protein QWY85_05570 [Neolewinella lacunae]|uniref:Uncharacterized protein n=1 Tax=Neolewinella lacunae TaxID=1517758 RepID=A0A923T829_9BACT|nr:hypothetical protein [Neolewinella lacunae]MBC6995170.1 hypothetical protein [Neolewinella lacunae]MDN3634120.1 hypothetical protein [Neolewinella lacunae]